MAYLNYNQVPITFSNSKDTTTLIAENAGSNLTVAATQAQFSYAPALTTQKLLGKAADRNDIRMAGPPNISLSFSCFLEHGEFDPFLFTGQTGLGTTAVIGDHANGIELSGLFLNSINLTISPYAPIVAQCDFVGYFPFKDTLTTQATNAKLAEQTVSNHVPDPDIDKLAHGVYSAFTGNLTDAGIFENVNYSYSAQYTPIYEIGSYNPTVIFTSAQQSIQIQADNIEDLVPITSGLHVSPVLTISNQTGTMHTLTLNGTLNSENVSLTAGDLARGQMTIIQPLK